MLLSSAPSWSGAWPRTAAAAGEFEGLILRAIAPPPVLLCAAPRPLRIAVPRGGALGQQPGFPEAWKPQGISAIVGGFTGGFG